MYSTVVECLVPGPSIITFVLRFCSPLLWAFRPSFSFWSCDHESLLGSWPLPYLQLGHPVECPWCPHPVAGCTLANGGKEIDMWGTLAVSIAGSCLWLTSCSRPENKLTVYNKKKKTLAVATMSNLHWVLDFITWKVTHSHFQLPWKWSWKKKEKNALPWPSLGMYGNVVLDCLMWLEQHRFISRVIKKSFLLCFRARNWCCSAYSFGWKVATVPSWGLSFRELI